MLDTNTKKVAEFDCVFLQGENGSTVPLRGVTAPEAQLLVMMHMPGLGKNPFVQYTKVGEADRSVTEELARLRTKYGREKVAKLFGPNTSIPWDFEEAISVAAGWVAEGQSLASQPAFTHKIA